MRGLFFLLLLTLSGSLAAQGPAGPDLAAPDLSATGGGDSGVEVSGQSPRAWLEDLATDTAVDPHPPVEGAIPRASRSLDPEVLAEHASAAAGASAAFPGAWPLGTCAQPCSGTDEGEPCGVTSNNGCNMVPFAPGNFRDLACGETICGTVWATGGARDTDFLRITLTATTLVQLELSAQLPVLLVLIEDVGGDCASLDLFASIFQPGNCQPVTISHTLPAGTYYVFLGPDPGTGNGLFEGYPCGGTNQYAITLGCQSPPCALPPGGTPENEPFPTSNNGGCLVFPPAYQPLAAGQTMRGALWAQNGVRDTDWYSFTLTGGAHEVAIELLAIAPVRALLVPRACGVQPILGTAESVGCQDQGSTGTPHRIELQLAPGDYAIIVVPADGALGDIFGGLAPSDPAAAYLLSLSATAAAPPCTLACNGAPESEPCGALFDGGCAGGGFPSFRPLEIDEPICGHIFASGGARDLDWFELGLPTAATLTLTLDSQFPAQLAVGQCGSVPGQFVVFGQAQGNECDAQPATLTIALEAGAAIVLVTAGTGPLGMGDLFQGYPCALGSSAYRLTVSAALPPPACDVSCTGTPELEPCGASVDNGCNQSPPGFLEIGLGETICGSAWASSGTRDTDWYRFTLVEPTRISWTLAGELPLIGRILEVGGRPPCDEVLFATPFTTAPGNCVPVTGPPIDLDCGTYTLFVAPATATGAAVRHGFPCGTRNAYRVTLNATPSTACFPPEVHCSADCDTGQLLIEVRLGQALTGYHYELVDPLGITVTALTLLAPQPACSVLTLQPGPYTVPGTYHFLFQGSCPQGTEVEVTCAVELAAYTGQTDVIWEPATAAPPPGSAAGLVPSAARLKTALVAAGRAPLALSDLLAFTCRDQLGPGDVLWVCLNTFPTNHVLTVTEGALLVELLARGVSIYLEGSDVWGFDAPTAFADHDGVLGRSTDLPGTFVADGDDSFTRMNGAAHGDLDLSAWQDIPYQQDNQDPTVALGNDSTDRLHPSQPAMGTLPDTTGTNAGVVWRNHPDGNPDPLIAEGAYATAIFHVPTQPCWGRVLVQSWEFGGFEGNRTQLATAYRAGLAPATAGGGFRRGDCNADGGLDIADPITLLAALFPTVAPPTLPCEDACDTNDDGQLDIADAIALLSFLFGSVPLPEPLCACGPDPTPDALRCASAPLPGCTGDP